MLSSKSRSQSIDFGQKNQSVFSRTLSASKLCRGNDALVSQIDPNALISVVKKNRVNKDHTMQQQTGQLEAELQRMREKLSVVEIERDQALDEIRRVEREHARDELRRAKEAQDDVFSPDKFRELMMEVKRLKDMLSNSQEQIKLKDDRIKELEESKREIIKTKVNVAGEAGEHEEIELLKNELKLAIEAEQKSAKAMEDLALVLKEVATEANQTKEKLNDSQTELVQAKNEVERYKKLLDESKQETELYRNTADRLKLEAEESLLAWNGKEMGFVSCIKRAEEEKAIVQHECTKLRESLKAAEHTSRVAREETFKLRDILKQAISEANAAKAAAGIAIEENSQLKDCLSEKDDALLFLTRENERLRINEAAARENMKEYKKLLSTASTELKIEDKEHYIMLKPPDSVDRENNEKNMNRAFSFQLEDLKFMNEPEDEYDNELDEDPEMAEALKGSIFDANAETPKAEPRTPQSVSSHRRLYSSPFAEDAEVIEHLESTHDESDSDRNSHRRRRTMFRRVGDLLMIRRSFHKKEPSTESHKKEQPSTENHKKEASSENHKKEASSENHKKESSSENHKKETKETSTENNKKESSTESHKKESSTESHKKESSTESHKKESSIESHKKESSTESQKKETSTESHQKEPSTESHRKESSTEKSKKEPSTE